MTEPIRIANCSGFYGDRLSAAREMVDGGPIDVLTGDWLAELTMLILARTRAKRPGGGFARTFVTQMEQVMGTCLDRGIKVVTNAGGLDPEGCADAVAEVADRLGLNPTVAFVTGDDLLPRIDELADHLQPFERMPLGDPAAYLSANAYVGSWGIVDALEQGADIVITGRATDAAIVCGPAAWHHGWARDDWDQLAGAIAAGHVIECGTQATGGNYSFFDEVPDLTRPGFPWAEIAADGSSVIGKHDHTGGQVSVGTVTSQLLYEIGGPQYLNPDVTTHFDTIEILEVEPDRVRLHGTKGSPPPDTLKVAMNELGGFRQDVRVALTGLDIEAKAELVSRGFWAACPYAPHEFASVDERVVHTTVDDPASNEAAVSTWRLTVRDPDERKVGRAVSNAVIELALANIPGFFGLSGGPGPGSPYGVFRPARIDAALVPLQVEVRRSDGSVVRSIVESSTGASARTAKESAPGEPSASSSQLRSEPSVGDDAPTVIAPLGRVLGARSGDKGGNANLGVFARPGPQSGETYEWMAAHLTVERLQALLPETASLLVERHELANLRSLNFVVHGLLGEGVAASSRQDPQAKSLGEWLRARTVSIPTHLISP